MQPRDYWRVLKKRWPLIVATVVVAVVASFLFARLQTPIYRATVFLTVSPARSSDYGQAMAIENQLRQFARLLQTNRLAAIVDERLQLDLPLDRLRSKVKVSAVSEDLLLMMEVDDTDPNRARDIAFVWADEFVRSHQDAMAVKQPSDRIEIALLDRPEPATLNFPKRTQIMLAAAILGLLLGTVLAFGLDFLDDTLKSPDDVDRFVGTPLLAMIPVNGAAKSSRASGHRASRALVPHKG